MKKIILPKRGSGSPNEEIEEIHSLVIVGANGSGKSRLGLWIENKNPSAYRISAQRALQFQKSIQPRGAKAAEALLHTGRQDGKGNARHRWGNDPIGHMLNDFDHLLSLFWWQRNMIVMLSS